MNFKSVLIAVSIGCATATAALTAPNGEPFMKTGGRVPQPVGHYYFCKAHPFDCKKTISRTGTMPLSEMAWHMIEDVNAAVNARIIQVTDEDYYGKIELWTYPRSAGDCEDFALLKKRELKARGFEEADLLITVVKKRDGSGHAVLTVHTLEGDFVLDNLNNQVKRWWQTPYRFEKRQSSENAGQWVSIEHPVGNMSVAAIKN